MGFAGHANGVGAHRDDNARLVSEQTADTAALTVANCVLGETSCTQTNWCQTNRGGMAVAEMMDVVNGQPQQVVFVFAVSASLAAHTCTYSQCSNPTKAVLVLGHPFPHTVPHS